jgi:hypothetical protein
MIIWTVHREQKHPRKEYARSSMPIDVVINKNVRLFVTQIQLNIKTNDDCAIMFL